MHCFLQAQWLTTLHSHKLSWTGEAEQVVALRVLSVVLSSQWTHNTAPTHVAHAMTSHTLCHQPTTRHRSRSEKDDMWRRATATLIGQYLGSRGQRVQPCPREDLPLTIMLLSRIVPIARTTVLTSKRCWLCNPGQYPVARAEMAVPARLSPILYRTYHTLHVSDSVKCRERREEVTSP